MIKKLLKWAVVLLILAIVSKGAMTYMAYRFIENMQQRYEQDVAFTYDWIDVSFSGEVTLENLTFTPFWLKQSFSTQALSFAYASIPEALEAFISRRDGPVPPPSSLSFKGLATRLEDQSSWWPGERPEFQLVTAASQIYACRNHSLLSLESTSRMGIREVNADIQMSFEEASGSGDKLFKAQFDLDQLGIYGVELRANGGQFERDFVPDLFNWNLKSIKAQYNEGGFMRRLSNFCSDMTGSDRNLFATSAASGWLVALKKQGLDMNAELALAYADFLASGGILEFTAYPKDALSLNALKTAYDQNYFDLLNAELRVNKSVVGDASLLANSAVLNPPEPQPAPVAKAAPVPVEQPKQNWLYKWESLESLIGRELLIQTLDGKTEQGTLVSFSDQGLKIERLVGGGKFGFNIAKTGITSIYIQSP